MTPRLDAQRVASYGRNGDSTLVHMAPREVAGLASLGAATGRHVTINPHTGLPEAFSFLDLLPMAAGLITAPFLGPIGAALASGVTAGAKTAAQGGNLGDIALSAGVSGIGSMAGAGIMDAATNAANLAASSTLSNAASNAASLAPGLATTGSELSTGALTSGLTSAPAANALSTSAALSPLDMGATASGSSALDVGSLAGQPTAQAATAPASQSFWDKGISNIQSIPDKLSAISAQPEAALKGAWGYIQENPMKTMGLGASLLGVGNYTPPQQPQKEKPATLRPGFGQPWEQTYTEMPAGYNPAFQGAWPYNFSYSPPIVPGPLNAAKGGEIRAMADGGGVELNPLAMLSKNLNPNWGDVQRQNPSTPNPVSVLIANAALQPTSNATAAPAVPGVSISPGMNTNVAGTTAESGSDSGLGGGVGAENDATGGGVDGGQGMYSGGRVHKYAKGGTTSSDSVASQTPAASSNALPYTPMPEGYNPAFQGAWDYNFQMAPSVAPDTSNKKGGSSSYLMGGFFGGSPFSSGRKSTSSAAAPTSFDVSYNPMPEGYNPALQGGWDYGFQSASNPMTTSGPMTAAGGGRIKAMADGGEVDQTPQNPLMSLSNSIISQPTSSTSTSPTNQSMISGMNYQQPQQPPGFSMTAPGFEGFPPDAPGLNMAGAQAFAEGGLASLDGDNSMGTTKNIVDEAKMAILGEHPRAQEALRRFSDTFGEGALSLLKNKFGGGRIKGAGGALDDLIPGTIEGKQQVRLADGEFVVPGDVVSGLGDGSTDQGVRKLHEMMRRVRQERTGKSTQPKRVNDRKVMPA